PRMFDLQIVAAVRLREDRRVLLQERLDARSALVGPVALQLLRIPEQGDVRVVVELARLDAAVASLVGPVPDGRLSAGEDEVAVGSAPSSKLVIAFSICCST